MPPIFRHGISTRILVNDVNLGSILNDSSIASSVDTAETSVYGVNVKTYVVGQEDATLKYSGLYDSAFSTAAGAKNRLHETLSGLIGSTAQAVNTYGMEGDTIGRRCSLVSGVVSKFDIKSPASDVLSVEVEQSMGGQRCDGEWLKDFTNAVTAASTFATVDGIKLTTAGGAVHAHVAAYVSSGQWTWKVQHSSNGSAWGDLTTARILNKVTTYQRVVLTGSIKRYVKGVITAKTGGNANIGIAYGRN